ncbi:hypothetical protein INT45_012667 [Circinella minor]|uniref:Uncharacterized protein n=1 Tax=Circinella minor TaxID=1195481 RepID=A0A8H7S4I9_9FUNG|nr:hypothetical protein INT45_012667 [Circinella minor]
MGWLHKTNPPVEVQLPERDARILAKYEYRAKQFDEMIKICCCWIGYDVLLDFIPIVGKVISLGFSLSMYRLSCQCDLPRSLRRNMLYNITVDFVLGLIPILGILLTALYRANTKNARLLRRFLYKRAAQRQEQQQTLPPSGSLPHSATGQKPPIQQPQPVATTPMPASFAASPSPSSVLPPPLPVRTSPTYSSDTNTPPPLPSKEHSYDSKPPPTPPR